MPILVACKCGKRFAALDHLQGRHLPCPECGNTLVVSSSGPNASKGIVLFCQCGLAFHADQSMRGGQGKCRCGRVLQLPGPDPLGLGDTWLTPVEHATRGGSQNEPASDEEIPWPILKVMFAAGIAALAVLVLVNTVLQIARRFWP